MVLVMIKNALFPKNGKNRIDASTLLPTYSPNLTPSDQELLEDDRDDGASEASGSTIGNKTRGESAFCFLVSPRVMSDIIIGLSDGLTVPFALTAGLTNLGDAKLVITGGMAELISGAISMGLGGYLAAKSESEYYNSQVQKQNVRYEKNPYSVVEEVQEILGEFNLSSETTKQFIGDLQKSSQDLINFNLKVGKGLNESSDSRQFTSAFTIGMSYFLGGFIPLIPYFFTHDDVFLGLYISAIVMAITLFAFGCIKTIISIGSDCGSYKVLSNGLKMMVTGVVAAAAAWGLVKAIQ